MKRSEIPKAGEDKMKKVIQQISTKELVGELLKREGVEHKKVEPYTDAAISANGPAILIKVID